MFSYILENIKCPFVNEESKTVNFRMKCTKHNDRYNVARVVVAVIPYPDPK